MTQPFSYNNNTIEVISVILKQALTKSLLQVNGTVVSPLVSVTKCSNVSRSC